MTELVDFAKARKFYQCVEFSDFKGEPEITSDSTWLSGPGLTAVHPPSLTLRG